MKQFLRYGDWLNDVPPGGMSEEATRGIARKVWLERFFGNDLLKGVGFDLIYYGYSYPKVIIEWGTSDEALATFGPGNPPYDKATDFLRKTSASYSTQPEKRVSETIIKEFSERGISKAYMAITQYEEKLISTRMGYHFLIDEIKIRWEELIPFSKIRDENLAFIMYGLGFLQQKENKS